MSCPISKDSLDQLKGFIDICAAKPEILSLSELGFFRRYIESLGGTIPSPKMSEPENKIPQEPETMNVEEEVASDPESVLEFDMEGCIEPDTVNEELQVTGDEDKQPSEEEIEQAEEKRVQAMSQFADGHFDKAVELFTEAIILNPQSALLFAKRGQTFLKLSKPNACIKDCTRALELNCDSFAAYKFRGRAHRLLAQWEEAARDLRQAVKIDYDEQTDEWLREVQPNAHKIEQHRLKQERKKLEKEELERINRVKIAREAHEKAAKGEAAQDAPNTGAQSVPGMGDIYKLLQDPEILAAFQDPEVAAAFQDISLNPGNFTKYQSNPKIKAVLEKLSNKVGSGMNFPGFPGGAGAGFPGFPGGFPTNIPPSTDKPPKTTDDDALD